MTTQPPLIGRPPVRSMGLKLLLVCALALLMTIPALFVFALLMDRTHRAEEVKTEVGSLMGGPQTFLGPVLAVPYVIPPQAKDEAPVEGTYVVFPAQARARVEARSEVRKRSLFSVPVYRSSLDFQGDFDLTATPARAPKGAVLDWSRAEFLIAVTDPRGAQSDVTLTVGGASRVLSPADSPGGGMTADGVPSRGGVGSLRFFGADAGAVARPGARFTAAARLAFSGAQRLAVLPYGKATTLEVRGDWPHPSFDGGILPGRKSITDKGFVANWTVPFMARGIPAEGDSQMLSNLGDTALGVSFVQPTDPYHSVQRSLKYALMFVSLVFLAYFVFETTTRRRVHPAQYVLIGLAQIVFYLLLLSLSEQIGFDWAFLAAAGVTVGLISAYAGWVFESRKQGLIALAAFSVLYGLIYILMRLEDFALLVGAVTSFVAIAAVMYVTRRTDWYGVTAAEKPPS